jgi:hypothetical protein
MRGNLRAFGAAVAVFAATLGTTPARAQKHGGVLKLYTLDSGRKPQGGDPQCAVSPT